MHLPLKIDSHIWIEKEHLSDEFISDLRDHLTVEVEEYGGDVRRFDFYEEVDDFIKLPKGMISSLVKALLAEEHNSYFIEETPDNYFDFDCEPIELRDHQAPAVASMLRRKVGIYQAPPGSGKTVTALETARSASQRTLILVDKVSIAEQWVERAQQFLNVKSELSDPPLNVGLIGDNTFDIQDITVATRQSIYSRKEELRESGFFSNWGMVIVDEVHHIQSNSYQEIIQEFNSEYLIGLSATPHKTPGMEKVVKFMIGDVIHETTTEELQGKDILVKPVVHVRETDFDAEYKTWVWNGKQMNNYQSIIKKLVEDESRNELIASDLLDLYSQDRKILVITKRLNHIKAMKQLLLDKDTSINCFELTGKESGSARTEVIDRIEQEAKYVLFSTVADEALDIPLLDTLFLVFPAKQEGLIVQQIGRIERNSEGKKAPIIVDYKDKSSLLSNQAYNRSLVYKTKGLEVIY